MNAPKSVSAVAVAEQDPSVAAFDNAPEEPLSDEELAAFQKAMADSNPGISTEELLERLRPKP